MWIVCSIPEIANSNEGGESWENTPINLDMIATFVKGEDFLFGRIGWQTIEFQDVSEETQLQWYFPDKESRDAEYNRIMAVVRGEYMPPILVPDDIVKMIREQLMAEMGAKCTSIK